MLELFSQLLVTPCMALKCAGSGLLARSAGAGGSRKAASKSRPSRLAERQVKFERSRERKPTLSTL